MGLRPTDGDENRRIGAGSVSALAWFFRGVRMGLRPTDDNENPPVTLTPLAEMG
jgi:hypothetical protein